MKNEIKIEKRVPLKEVCKYPFKKMNISDSFLLPLESSHEAVRVRAIQFAKDQKPVWKFSIKKTEAGYRCWRIK